MYLTRVAAAVAIAGTIPLCAAAAAESSVERGQAFAARHCATCHATGSQGESPYSAAPPFRILLQRSPIDYLTRTLESGLAADHRAFREMQGFVLSPAETADLVAYWRTLQTTR
jgi:mono/diheme cytochrome c family protein